MISSSVKATHFGLSYQFYADKKSVILLFNSSKLQAFQILHFNILASGYKCRKMKTRTTLNYYAKIKSLLSSPMFKFAKYSLENSSNEQLEAFWHIIIAGYPIDFALDNYRKLHEFLKNNAMDYTEALDTYISYPGLETGMHLVKTRWYELN